ncbi:MAG TPA: alpha/beta hydrolase [Bauldia sp.]|nr:alpha/beta hydrolase [Bauldia sp.]
MAETSSAEASPVAPSSPAAGGRALAYRSSDGLALHVAEYGERASPWLPVVCLPGLTRSARDFGELAAFLAGPSERPRRVLAFDYRGRGSSEWARDAATYAPLTEMQDVLDGMAALGVGRAVIVGTSRGGILGMLIAVARPAVLAGLVLNDIGPVMEPTGLARIKGYVGRTPVPDDWNDAVAILKRLHAPRFPALSEDDWHWWARMTWREDGHGKPAPAYDPALAQSLDAIEFDRPIPSLWDHFNAVGVPVLAIRGEHSDLLSADTFAAMAARPNVEAMTVPGQGHAPLLRGEALLQRIAAFVSGIEGRALPVDAVVARASTESPGQ